VDWRGIGLASARRAMVTGFQKSMQLTKMLILLVLIIRGPEAGPNERTAFYASSWKMHRPDHCLVHVRLQAYVPRRKSVVVSSILLNPVIVV